MTYGDSNNNSINGSNDNNVHLRAVSPPLPSFPGFSIPGSIMPPGFLFAPAPQYGGAASREFQALHAGPPGVVRGVRSSAGCSRVSHALGVGSSNGSRREILRFCFLTVVAYV